MELAKLGTRINGAFAWLGFLTVASGVAFLFLIGQFGEVNKGVTEVKSTVAAQSATMQAVKESVDRLADNMDRQNDNSQTSPQKR